MEFLSDVLWGGLCVLLDSVLTIVELLISGIQLGSTITNSLSAWGALPPQMVYIVNATGLPDALGIIGTAFGIRFLLNLIPAAFTRV